MTLSFRTSSRPMRYPFGRPVLPRPPPGDGPARVVVVGAHPSALHVRWTPPEPWLPIRAVAVEDAPDPFWEGSDDGARVEAWKQAVGFDPEWGDIAPAGRLNVPGGTWGGEEILADLGVSAAEVRVTDILDTYRCSPGLAARLVDTYRPFAESTGLPAPRLLAEPSEAAVVREALARHRSRLRQVLAGARPELVVTVGNAALQVVRELVEQSGGGPPVPDRLSPLPEEYGRRYVVGLEGARFELLPLAHPAAAATYQQAHRAWRLRRGEASSPSAPRHPYGC